jgi:hypothetical protein
MLKDKVFIDNPYTEDSLTESIQGVVSSASAAKQSGKLQSIFLSNKIRALYKTLYFRVTLFQELHDIAVPSVPLVCVVLRIN